ncbi:MAG: alpha/beta hydrolase [Alcaligenaceae bacterium]|nr:alpha/beta hydrolase [Alcaligenaceae bacterium]
MTTSQDSLSHLENRFPWREVEVAGHAWRWLDTASEGPAVILLPGSVGDSAMYMNTLFSLGDRLRLIALTYPALSDPRELTDGLNHVMDHLGLCQATVVGSSFAAYWIQFFGLEHPDRVHALMICNGFTDGADLAENPLFDRDYVENLGSRALHQEWVGRVREAPVTPLQQLQEVMLGSRQSPDNLYARFLGVVRAQPCPALGLDPSRITILDCEDDPLIPLAARERLRSRYPESNHVTLDHGGHYPYFLNPHAYEAALIRCTET